MDRVCSCMVPIDCAICSPSLQCHTEKAKRIPLMDTTAYLPCASAPCSAWTAVFLVVNLFVFKSSIISPNVGAGSVRTSYVRVMYQAPLFSLPLYLSVFQCWNGRKLVEAIWEVFFPERLSSSIPFLSRGQLSVLRSLVFSTPDSSTSYRKSQVSKVGTWSMSLLE